MRSGLIAFVGFLALVLASCGGSGEGSTARASPHKVRASGDRAVRLKVVRSHGTVTALVPVYIDDRGPYTFILDTGAVKSVVNEALAARLHLKVLGVSRPLSGVIATTRALKLQVTKWRAGDIKLMPDTVEGLALPPQEVSDGLVGLLGSDVLSRYGQISIQYNRRRLVLGR